MPNIKPEVDYRNPLCLLYAIPIFIIGIVMFVCIGVYIGIRIGGYFFYMLIVKDETFIRKRYNKFIDKFKSGS